MFCFVFSFSLCFFFVNVNAAAISPIPESAYLVGGSFYGDLTAGSGMYFSPYIEIGANGFYYNSVVYNSFAFALGPDRLPGRYYKPGLTYQFTLHVQGVGVNPTYVMDSVVPVDLNYDNQSNYAQTTAVSVMGYNMERVGSPAAYGSCYIRIVFSCNAPVLVCDVGFQVNGRGWVHSFINFLSYRCDNNVGAVAGGNSFQIAQLGSSVTSGLTNIQNAVTTGSNNVVTSVNNMGTKVVNAVTSIGNQISNAVADAGHGIQDKIQDTTEAEYAVSGAQLDDLEGKVDDLQAAMTEQAGAAGEADDIGLSLFELYRLQGQSTQIRFPGFSFPVDGETHEVWSDTPFDFKSIEEGFPMLITPVRTVLIALVYIALFVYVTKVGEGIWGGSFKK